MSKRFHRTVAACLLGLSLLQPAAIAAEVPPLTQDEAIALAETYNPGLQLALFQMRSSRTALTKAPANAGSIAPVASLYAQMQLGLTIPESAISPTATLRQSQIGYEQAAAQYYSTRQQVRLGALQAYVEWQRASALVAAQESALDRALHQEQQVQAMLDAGLVAKYDLLQAQAQVAGQQAALAGAQALLDGARQGLEQAIGRPLVDDVIPAAMQITSGDVTLTDDLPALTARAMANRTDLHDSALDLASRRLQVSLANNSATTVFQLQAAAHQYELAAVKARSEVRQAYLGVQTALAELKARETALGPAQEALRLAELRYEAGLATYLEVQSAFAGALQAEAARIQAAANLTLNLARLGQATGDL